MIADVLVPKNPMRRILLGCCASEATGQAAAPPRIVMNARRFTVRCLSRAFDRKDSTLSYGRRLLRCGISPWFMTAVGHVWTAPAVQEESDYQRSVRVVYSAFECGRLAAGPDVIR